MIQTPSTQDWTNRPNHASRFDFRNPPLLWRCVFVGITLALPGTIAGLILALLLMLPGSWAPFCAVTGSLVGFLSGFYVERH